MEATTTLADALLDDLDDLNDSSDDEENETIEIEHGDNNEHHQNEDDRILNQPKGSETVAVSRFIDNKSLQQHLNIIREIVNPHASQDVDNNLKVAAAAAAASSTSTATRQKEKEEENHQLVVKSNKYLASLGEEMGRAHGELAKTYKAKFPELEELLPNHINYKNAVRAIGNETDLTRVNDKLNEILSSNQIITISVAGSTTSGRQLTEAELHAVGTAANYMEELLVVQQQLMKFVENSMESLCPSICALIGSSIAARLLGLAGGLQELTKVSNGATRETKRIYLFNNILTVTYLRYDVSHFFPFRLQLYVFRYQHVTFKFWVKPRSIPSHGRVCRVLP
jgi:U4/U6 small nuclear ribonucleoprotein PRP31